MADLVRSAIPRGSEASAEKIDPATRTFLALRMKVNREVENLASPAGAAPRVLKAGGRLAVISFQSTEDRMVKQAFRSAEQTGQFKILTTKPITPTERRSRPATDPPRSRCVEASSRGREDINRTESTARALGL